MTKDQEIAQLKQDIGLFSANYKLIIAHNMVSKAKCQAVKDQDYEMAAKLRDEQRSIEDELTSMHSTIEELSKKYSV